MSVKVTKREPAVPPIVIEVYSGIDAVNTNIGNPAFEYSDSDGYFKAIE